MNEQITPNSKRKRIFIFSTREYCREGFLFGINSKENNIENVEYKQFRLQNSGDTKNAKDDFKQWLRTTTLSEEQSIKIKDIIRKKQKNDKTIENVYNKIIAGKDEQITEYFLKENQFLELLEYFASNIIFKYYEINTETEDKIIAIPLLDSYNSDDKGWINAIFDVFTQEENSSETEYFLLLHDKDLKGFSDKDLYVLNKG